MTDQQSLILIVDDNQTNLKVLFDCLKAANYRVLVASSGESAMEKVQVISPDLILLDVMMPGIDGFEVCRHLKASTITQDLPVIFMTALSDSVDKVKGLSLGAVDYITKPFQQEEVLARVTIHLKLHHLNRQLERRVAERTADLQFALEQLQQSQLQLVQSEKMSTLGQLVAGVAHEINNPVGFIKGNLTYAKEYIQSLIAHLALYQTQATPAEITSHAEQIDLNYLTEDVLKILTSMEEGAERIGNISISLRTFSRADSTTQIAFNLHEGIDSTLLILKHRLKGNSDRPDIEVVRDYGELPEVECLPGQLNQVFMNLLANAIDALEESNQGKSFQAIESQPNCILIQTRLSEDQQQVLIRIQDNGIGIPEPTQQQIFDQLFTTKPVGKGTGLGLTIARQILVDKHGGTIQVCSQPGQGTEFLITLPVHSEISPARSYPSGNLGSR